QPDHVAVISRQVAAVMNDGYSVGRVDHQAHAVGDVFADKNLGSAPFEQRFLGNVGISIGKLAFRKFHGDVFQHVAHAAPSPSGGAQGYDGGVDGRQRLGGLSVDVRRVRRCMVIGACTPEVEGRRLHLERIEYRQLHGSI